MSRSAPLLTLEVPWYTEEATLPRTRGMLSALPESLKAQGL